MTGVRDPKLPGKDSPEPRPEYTNRAWYCCRCSSMQHLTFSSANPCLDKNNKRCTHSKCSECHLETFPIVESSTSTSRTSTLSWFAREDWELENVFLQNFSDSGVGGVGSRLRFTPTGDILKVTGDAVRNEFPNESTSEIWEDKEASKATSGRLDIADSGTKEETYIPLTGITESCQPKYAIKLPDDEILKHVWDEKAVPSLLTAPEKLLDLDIVGFQLVRQGETAETAVPTIAVDIAETSNKTDEEHRNSQQQVISSCVAPNYHSLLRISIGKRSIREFGVEKNGIPGLPDNNHFQIYPGLGASIGIEGITNNTATLGGYLMIDNQPYLVTSSHLLPFHRDSSVASQRQSWIITHVSGEDSSMRKGPLQKMSELLINMTACCDACKQEEALRQTCPRPPYPPTTQASKDLCQNLQKYLVLECPTLHLGELKWYSGDSFRQSQYTQLTDAKMDWALARIDGWPRDMSAHIGQISRDLKIPPPNDLGVGKRVKATGRTTAMQKGIISHSPYTHLDRIDQNGKIMPYQEYPMMRERDDDVLGYKGDSGSFIIGEQTNYIYGVLWGGDMSTLDKIYYVPMLDMVDDIKEKAGTPNVSLPGRPAQTFSTGGGTEIDAGVHKILPMNKEKGTFPIKAPLEIVAGPQQIWSGDHDEFATH